MHVSGIGSAHCGFKPTYMAISQEQIWQALQAVKDPEIPTVSLVELGVVTGVEIDTEGAVRVTMTPTFVGCPALNCRKRDVENQVREIGVERFEVVVNFDVPWSSTRITEEGRARILEHGITPPEVFAGSLQLDVLNHTSCPFCGSRN